MELINQEIKFRYKHWMTDKYNRSMFVVDEPKLVSLYAECQAENRNVSLFKSEEDELIMVISNFAGDDLKDEKIFCREYKGSVRFYVQKKYEWKEM